MKIIHEEKDGQLIPVSIQVDNDAEIDFLLDQLRPKGTWIELPKAYDSRELPCKCSLCGHILSFMNYYPKSNFCPNCGADMRGGKNETSYASNANKCT